MNRRFGLLISVLIIAALGSGNAPGQVENGGFEETRVVKDSEPLYQVLKEKNWKFDEPVTVPKGWVPNVYTDNGEYRFVDDKAQAHSGNACIYIKGDFHSGESAGIGVEYGDQIIFSFWAKDPNSGAVGGCLYAYGQEGGRDKFLGSDLSFAETAGAEWKKYSGTLTIPVELQGCPIKFVSVALRSVTGAYFDDVTIELKKGGEAPAEEASQLEGKKKQSS